jgi:hypothetical protein
MDWAGKLNLHLSALTIALLVRPNQVLDCVGASSGDGNQMLDSEIIG